MSRSKKYAIVFAVVYMITAYPLLRLMSGFAFALSFDSSQITSLIYYFLQGIFIIPKLIANMMPTYQISPLAHLILIGVMFYAVVGWYAGKFIDYSVHGHR